jgi:ribosome biogenesis GTPase / thiamine phosphate phosphatase
VGEGAPVPGLTDPEPPARGLVVSVLGPTALVSGDGRVVEAQAQPGGGLAVGDHVTLAPGAEGPVIESVEERRSVFSRLNRDFSRDDAGGREQVLAANVDLVVIVASPTRPAFRPGQVDRYLVLAERNDLPALLCLNKVDLGDADTSEFEAAGYDVVRTSTALDQGRDELMAYLTGKVSVLTGSSGVGKTSLLNWVGGTSLPVGETSERGGRGRHTTTTSTVIELDGGGLIIDTPGIRALELLHIEADELGEYFPEMVERASGCRFRDCAHVDEPDCAVKAAVEAGEVSARRYENYVGLFERSTEARRR